MQRSAHLNREEREQLKQFSAVPINVIFEAIRQEGAHELSRSFRALWWSGVAAGLAISVSVLAKGALAAHLPHADWAPLVTNMGYTIGFLIVILGRMQLFTENTITPILQLFLDPRRRNLSKILRLWSIVFLANLVGCGVAAWVMVKGGAIPPVTLDGVLYISRHYAEASAWQHFTHGIPAGFLIAALVWMLPGLSGSGEVVMIVIITWLIGAAGLSHVVAGSTELFALVLNGEMGLVPALTEGVAPAFAGNVLGGTGIFAALLYAQTREEI
ncbi:formate/nitrite transporter family protein [Rhodovulum sp. DZ06]|uniref:formate/nitrite transporter family protein n=1 Tax=Rhodovulum sp. DZ06 TaxID=3425126 RepID=UPI003D33359B